MGGKKIYRKKQSLLSRAATRKALIKKLTHKPVIKNIDIEAIKESFRKAAEAHAHKKTQVTDVELKGAGVEQPGETKPKKTRKPKPEGSEG